MCQTAKWWVFLFLSLLLEPVNSTVHYWHSETLQLRKIFVSSVWLKKGSPGLSMDSRWGLGLKATVHSSLGSAYCWDATWLSSVGQVASSAVTHWHCHISYPSLWSPLETTAMTCHNKDWVAASCKSVWRNEKCGLEARRSNLGNPAISMFSVIKLPVVPCGGWKHVTSSHRVAALSMNVSQYSAH